MDFSTIGSIEFWHGILNVITIRGGMVIIILIFFFLTRYVAYRLIDRMVARFTARQPGGPATAAAGRICTLGSLVRSIIFYVLIFIAAVMILDVFAVDPRPVLTAAGVVGLAVGFGAQRLVRDIISGFFIVLENQYSVGDYITVGPVTGTVEEFGMRITQLRDDVGKLIVIANGDITQVINHSRGPIQAVLDVSVTADSDPDKVRELINDVGRDVAAQVEGILSPPKAGGMIAADAVKMTFRVAGEIQAGRHEIVQAALRESIRERFAHEEIKLV